MRGKGKKPTLCIEDLGFSFSLRSAGDLIPYAAAVFFNRFLSVAEAFEKS